MFFFFFFSSRRRHTRSDRDWSSDVCSSDLALADGPTTVRGIGFIRRKESDRIAAVVTELRRCGIGADELPDGFVVRPAPVRPARVRTYDDHRMAMSFALLGLARPGIEIEGPGCVAKTFPTFWEDLEQLRGRHG